MNSFYWTWINLRIEISQLLLSDDLSPPEDVLSIKKKKLHRKETKVCAAFTEKAEEGGPVLWSVSSGTSAPAYENTNK